MPHNNLRIIYNNIVDSNDTTITSTPTFSEALGVSNLRNNYKSRVWMSGVYSGLPLTPKFVLTFPSQSIGGVIIPYTTLSNQATIRVRAYTGTAPVIGGTLNVPTLSTPGTLVYDSGNITACPTVAIEGVSPRPSNFSQSTSPIARVWFDQNYTCTSLAIEISDPLAGQDSAVHIGKMVVGKFWSSEYNVWFGMGSNYTDLSTTVRMVSGDSLVNLGAKYKGVTCELKYISMQDKTELRQILQRNGLSKPIFISLFPQIEQHSATAPTATEYDTEYTYSVYGRISQADQLVFSNYLAFSTNLTIEEI